MKRHHFYKQNRADAIAAGQHALSCLERAEAECELARSQLELSGYKGAARGVRQAGLRISEWRCKVSEAIYEAVNE